MSRTILRPFSMKILAILACCTAVALGRSVERSPKAPTLGTTADFVISGKSLENRQGLWRLFKGLIPSEYYDLVVNQELYENTEFQKDVFNLALKQISVDVDTQIAKQSKLRDFVLCSCPTSTCGSIDVDLDDFRHELSPFFEEIKSGTDFEVALKTLRLLKFGMDQIQQRFHHLVRMVDCSCPLAAQCRKTLTPQLYDIISGKSDKSLRNAYWQNAFQASPLFPSIVPQELYHSLQSTWSSLLEGFFGSVIEPSWGWFGQFIPSWVHSHNSTVAAVPTNNPTFVSGTFVGPDGQSGTFGVITTSVGEEESEEEEEEGLEDEDSLGFVDESNSGTYVRPQTYGHPATTIYINRTSHGSVHTVHLEPAPVVENLNKRSKTVKHDTSTTHRASSLE